MSRFLALLFLLTLPAVPAGLLGASGCVVQTSPVLPCASSVTCPEDRPVCDSSLGGCRGCRLEEECTEGLCNVETGACVECLEDDECTDADSPHCDETNACVACTIDAHCDDIDGRRVCHLGACSEGCTLTNEAVLCGENACDTGTRNCTSTKRGSRGVCETCVADSECGDGEGAESNQHRCIPMDYDGARYPSASTGFCLETTDLGCGEPYTERIDDRESLSGAPADDYCGIVEALTTCDAVNALVDNSPVCPGGSDSECPTGGLCRQVGTVMNRCTYECRFAIECLPMLDPPPPGSTCGGGSESTPDYCGGDDE